MNLSEDEIGEENARKCGHCNRNTLLPYEKRFTCIGWGYYIIKRKQGLTKFQRKKLS